MVFFLLTRQTEKWNWEVGYSPPSFCIVRFYLVTAAAGRKAEFGARQARRKPDPSKGARKGKHSKSTRVSLGDMATRQTFSRKRLISGCVCTIHIN